VCPAGWTGEYCGESLEHDACRDFECHNDGSCYLTDDGAARCQCPAGYSGDHCETAPAGACNGGITVDAGEFSEFGWWDEGSDRAGYPNGLRCSWTIEVPEDKVARLWFDRIDTFCDADYVEVTVGDASRGAYCGSGADDIPHMEFVGEAFTVTLSTSEGGDRGYLGFWAAFDLDDRTSSSSASGSEGGDPVDCRVADWSYWGDCDEPADGCVSPGRQVRSRDIVEPEAFGGEQCPELEQERACLPRSCLPVACTAPPQRQTAGNGHIGIGSPREEGTPLSGVPLPDNLNCEWEFGPVDASGGPPAHVSVAVVWADVAGTDDCNSGVLTIQGQDLSTGRIDDLGYMCHGQEGARYEFDGQVIVRLETSDEGAGRPGVGFRFDYEIEAFSDNFDCELGEWSEWSDCDPSCGGEGTQARERVIVQQPVGNGLPCPGPDDLRMSRPCHTDPCRPVNQDAAATVTVFMDPDIFNEAFLAMYESFAAEFAADVANLLDVPGERVAVIEVNAAGDSPTIVFEILPAHGIPGPPASHLVDQLQEEMRNPESRLWTSGAASFMAADREVSATFADPAKAAYDPEQVSFTLTASSPDDSGDVVVTVVNQGGSVLLVSAVSIVGDDNDWLAVAEPHTFPVRPANIYDMHFQFKNLRSLAAGKYFKVVEVEHNVPNGPHSIPVTLVVEGTSSGSGDGPHGQPHNNDPDGPLGYADEQGFWPGVIAAVGGMLALLLVSCCCVWFYRRKVRPFCRTLCGKNVRDLEAQRVRAAASRQSASRRSTSEEETSSMLRATDSAVEMSSVAVTVPSTPARTGGSGYSASASPRLAAARLPVARRRAAVGARVARLGAALVRWVALARLWRRPAAACSSCRSRRCARRSSRPSGTASPRWRFGARRCAPR